MTTEVSSIVEELILQLRSDQIPLESVYLFGAYSTDKFNEHSKIDLAIVLNEIEDLEETQKEIIKYKRKVDFRLELYAFEKEHFNIKDPFASEILKTGIKVL